jgi:hypothetical protein
VCRTSRHLALVALVFGTNIPDRATHSHVYQDVENLVPHPDRRIITREALSDVLVNTFTEDGRLAGLDGFVDEYGKLSEHEPTEAQFQPRQRHRKI